MTPKSPFSRGREREEMKEEKKERGQEEKKGKGRETWTMSWGFSRED
jgi:hypothetical protein